MDRKLRRRRRAGDCRSLVAGMVLEIVAVRRLYGRSHLDHVLGTFGLLLFFNEFVRLVWGPAGMTLSLPPQMLDAVEIMPGVYYPAYRSSSSRRRSRSRRCFMSCHAHPARHADPRRRSNREMVAALGINIKLLYTLVFGLGAALAGFAG